MITVTGSLAFDHIMDFAGKFADHIMPDKIHQINLSFLVNTLERQRGGNAGNISYTLALLQIPASILSTAGNDFSDYAKFLQDNGVDTSNIKISPNKKTASAFMMTDLSDNQISAFYPGAMKENISLTLKGIKTDLVVITPDEPKAMVKFSKECQDSNIPYMLDPGMQLPALDTEDLKNMVIGAFILIGNDYEISLLKEKTSLSEEQLLNQVRILVTTLGAEGSIIQTKEEKIEISAARPIEIATGPSDPRNDRGVIDPTGAGDAYRAGFLAGYMKKMDLKVCGQMGSVAACYAIEKYGTSNHKFTIEEFTQRYQENFGEKINL